MCIASLHASVVVLGLAEMIRGRPLRTIVNKATHVPHAHRRTRIDVRVRSKGLTVNRQAGDSQTYIV